MQEQAWRETWWFKAALGLALGLVVMLVTQGWPVEFGALQDIELLTIDQRFERRGVERDLYHDGDVVIVGISDRDLEALPQSFPFPRDYYAHVVENLKRAGARVVAFDMTFESEGRGDDRLREVLARHDDVVLAVKNQALEVGGLYREQQLQQDYNNVFYSPRQHVGIVDVLKDRDGVVRRYTPMMEVGGHLTPTFAFAAVARALDLPPRTTVELAPDYFTLGKLEVPRYDPRTFLLNYYGPVQTFRYVPFSHVIDDERFTTLDEQLLETELNLFDEGTMSLFRDKIVLVGSLMAEERDFHPGPFVNPGDADGSRAIHGVEIHATAVQNLLDGRFIERPPRWVEAAVIPMLALLSFLLLLAFRKLSLRPVALMEVGALAVVALIVFGLYEGALLAFEHGRLLVSYVHPGLAVVVAYVGAGVYQFMAERQQKVLIKSAFSHYVSPQVVNDLISDPGKIRLGGERREMTVIFTDIAGFTTMSEQLGPEELVDLLNEYLDEMAELVFENEGTIDKFEGDAVMAFWGAPVEREDHALRACRTVLQMQDKLNTLREDWMARGLPRISIRCGVNTGPMVVGNMGGARRFDYTVIGDSVNLAARLEGANKAYGSRIMISESTYAVVREQVVVRELDLLQVKGKTEPIRVYELLGLLDDRAFSDTERQATLLYERGLQHYRAREWDAALRCMEEALALDPDCAPARVYVKRAQHYRQDPPPESWNGVFVMKTK